jgi:hypothetical protein
MSDSATLDLSAMLKEMIGNLPTDKPATQQDLLRAKRSASTAGNRIVKKERKEEVLASVDGDAEKLITISLWQPRTVKTKLFARAFDKAKLAATGEAFIDAEYDGEDTEYKLVEEVCERAKPPADEVAFAKLQGRFQEQTRSINGFFAADPIVITKHKATDYYAPLGDFNWCDDVVPAHERAAQQKRWAAAHNKPVRNIKEGAMH